MLHNITIVLNNVILKYAEEDLVLSLNVKAIEVASADASWQPAFAQLATEDPVLRKLVSMEDVTICLDKVCRTSDPGYGMNPVGRLKNVVRSAYLASQLYVCV